MIPFAVLVADTSQNRSQMAKTAQLSDFDEELYKVTGDGEDKYLIATVGISGLLDDGYF